MTWTDVTDSALVGAYFSDIDYVLLDYVQETWRPAAAESETWTAQSSSSAVWA